jgi:hypothetical protein
VTPNNVVALIDTGIRGRSSLTSPRRRRPVSTGSILLTRTGTRTISGGALSGGDRLGRLISERCPNASDGGASSFGESNPRELTKR